MKNKIPMNISIQTDQNIETPQGEPVSESVHTNAFGFLRETKNGMELEYLESKDKTFGDTVTTVSMLKDNIVAVNRIGALNTYMVFEEGKAHTCLYTGERVPVQLLRNSISPQGGKLDIDYTVQIAGNTAECSHILMSVSPHESILTS